MWPRSNRSAEGVDSGAASHPDKARTDGAPVIRTKDLAKVYSMGEFQVHALRGLSFEVSEGELLSIMGPSGSGKSTLMNIIGCLDQSTSGQYWLSGQDVSELSDDDLANIRNQRIGFVFQNFNLLARTSALQNVELPLIYAGTRNRRRVAQEALESVGLADRLHHRPNELSGGQQQRVAIARALVTNPAIILADEPTGNLDSQSGAEIAGLFQKLNREKGLTVIFVTHDASVARHTDRILYLSDGSLVDEEIVTDRREGARHVGAPEAIGAGAPQ